MPLKFNDKLIAIDLPTYNVTVLPSSNGSVTATPSSGVPGTIVSLSNTPDERYILDRYELTGAKLYDGNKFMIKKYDVSVQGYFSPKLLTIDLNTQGTDCTTEFLTQTKYPGVWTGYKVFRLGGAGLAENTHYYNFIKNISNLTSNFTMYYFFAMYYNNTGRAWGKATYSVDSSNCVAQTSGWTPGGQDSQKPQYDKSRYRSVTVNVSKGGNINWDFYYNNDPWYGNSIYYAIPQELVQDVINSK